MMRSASARSRSRDATESKAAAEAVVPRGVRLVLAE
jgi:hypothetical protein